MNLEFSISAEDGERLFAIKELQGKDDLTGNEFAAEILQRELHRLFPAVPEYDENDRLTNADKYRGNSSGELQSSLLDKITTAYNEEAAANYRRGELDFVPENHSAQEVLTTILVKYALSNYPNILKED